MNHILIIEDELTHVELIKRGLERSDMPPQISHAGTLAEAEKFIAARLPDLALVDYRLPDGHGDEFVATAAGRFPVILLTSFGSERLAVEAIKAGALDYVAKSPEMFAEVGHLVERSLREWRNLHARKRADERLEAVNELLATMGPDFAENIRRLVTLLGREMGASMAFYNQAKGDKLQTIAAWQVKECLPRCNTCHCETCAEVLNYAAGNLLHVGEARTNPKLEALFLRTSENHTLLGKVIRQRHQPVGVICLFFEQPYQINEADRRLLGIFGAALGAEENRKRTDDELRISDERYRQIVQTAYEGIWVTDESSHITFANQRMANMLGFPTEEILGRPMHDFIDKAELADHEQQLQLCRLGQSTQYERHLRQKNGDVLLTRVSACPLFDDDRVFRGGFAMLTDITEHRQLESQLRQAQKLESVGQLAGGVAHDFNNILAAIMMHLSLLHQDPNLDADTVEALKELEVETKRAANLTRQLLMFSRRSVMQVRQMDLNEVVQNMLKMLRRLLGENITIKFESHNGLPNVDADNGMLEQVLMNLTVNARDAMPRGGSLTIATNMVEIDAEAAKLNSERRLGKFVSLSVSDTGLGMDEVTLKRIFEPFFTTKEVGKGTGLGLPTVYGIIKQHQGWIEVKSTPGGGSVFEVFLPVKSPAGSQTGHHPASLTAPRGHGTILLVEDEDIVRRPIGIYLRKLGYEVIEAANGNQAIAQWREHGPKIDLLYTDMVMPEGVSGLELAEKLKAEKSGLKIIISSGYSPEISLQGVSDDSGFVYLPKPSPSATIATIVRDCLEQK